MFMILEMFVEKKNYTYLIPFCLENGFGFQESWTFYMYGHLSLSHALSP